MSVDSVGGGESGGTSRPRNSPLRSRSARMIGVIPPGAAASPGNGTMAIGMRCAPAPVISMESCARAASAASSRQAPNVSAERRASKTGILLKLVFFSAPLFVLRAEVKFQLTLEQACRLRLGQRGRPKDSALHRVVVTLVAARFAHPHLKHVTGRQQADIEDGFGVAGHVLDDLDGNAIADLGADLVHPGRERPGIGGGLLLGEHLLDLALLRRGLLLRELLAKLALELAVV